MNRRLFLLAALPGLAALRPRRASASPVTKDALGDSVQTLRRDQLPEFATTTDMKTLYRFAVDHGDELRYIPCYCGCTGFGHRSNRDCYVKAVNRGGTVTYTSHAAT